MVKAEDGGVCWSYLLVLSSEVDMFLIRAWIGLEVCRLVAHCNGHVHAMMELLMANQQDAQGSTSKIGQTESVPLYG
jgi:hypothetical protein